MRSSATQYTRRCSWFRRRDHAPTTRCFSRSDFPIPEKGSLKTASTRSSTRSAVLLSCCTQCFGSSRNSGWNTATRLPLGKAEFPAQLTHRRRRQHMLLGTEESTKKPPRIRRRVHEMRGLGQRRQLFRADQGHVFTTGPANEHRLPGRSDLVAQRRQRHAGLVAGRDLCGAHQAFLGSEHDRIASWCRQAALSGHSQSIQQFPLTSRYAMSRCDIERFPMAGAPDHDGSSDVLALSGNCCNPSSETVRERRINGHASTRRCSGVISIVAPPSIHTLHCGRRRNRAVSSIRDAVLRIAYTALEAGGRHG